MENTFSQIDHKVYNYEIGNSTSGESKCFTVYNLDKQNKIIKIYKDVFNEHCNEKNFKSCFYVDKFYTKYNSEKKYSYCDYLHPISKPLHIYLTGIWTTIEYLQRVCNKWNLKISDFKKRIENNRFFIYEFFDTGFENI